MNRIQNKLARTCVLSLIAAAFSHGHLPQTARANGDDILRTGQRLLTEERVQIDTRRRINSVVRRLDWERKRAPALESIGVLRRYRARTVYMEDKPNVAGFLSGNWRIVRERAGPPEP